MRVLVTGATGKVGQTLIARLSREPSNEHVRIRALCHNRLLPETATMSVMRGSIDERDVCRSAVQGMTHVVHLATCKETPDEVMDVTVKGLFWLLEEFRSSPTAQRFVLIGGDALTSSIGIRPQSPRTRLLQLTLAATRYR